jgi:hypothetical protein
MAQDIGLLLRGLGAAFSNTVPQFRDQMLQEEENAYIRSGREREAQMQRAEMTQARQRAMYQDAESALKLLAAGDLDSVISLGRERIELLKNFPDADPSDTVRITQLAQLSRAGDRNAYQSLQRELLGAVNRGMAMGYITPPQQPEIVPGSAMVDGYIMTRDASGNFVANRPQGFQVAEKPDEELAQETSEARNFIRQNITDINKNIAEITTAYEKVSSLESQMRQGNRSAINAAIMNTARLISPGVVTDRDAAAFSGANTNIGAMYEFLSGKGIDVSELVRIYDPSNPEIFDPDALLNVARSVTASALPSQLARFEDQKVIANQYSLSPRFVNSFLDANSNLMKSAQRIQQSIGGSTQQTRAQPAVARFNSIQEAEAAVQSGRVAIGDTVEALDENGNAVQFIVEE